MSDPSYLTPADRRRLDQLAVAYDQAHDAMLKARIALYRATKQCVDAGAPIVTVSELTGISRPTIYKIRDAEGEPPIGP